MLFGCRKRRINVDWRRFRRGEPQRRLKRSALGPTALRLAEGLPPSGNHKPTQQGFRLIPLITIKLDQGAIRQGESLIDERLHQVKPLRRQFRHQASAVFRHAVTGNEVRGLEASKAGREAAGTQKHAFGQFGRGQLEGRTSPA